MNSAHGTDPIEGSSLAISILEYLHNKACLTISTTHYPEIKNFALVTDGFENASSEFDIENLRPTYKLLIGVPGKSNAFAISKRLGLNEDILNRAKSLVDSDTISIEELLKNIYDNKLMIDKEKEDILTKSKKIEELKKSLELDNSNLKNQTDEIIRKAKLDARSILDEAKEDATRIIKQLESISSNKEINTLRNELNQKIKNTDSGNILKLPNNAKSIKLGANSDFSFNDNTINKNKNHNISIKNTISSEINLIGYNVDEALSVLDKYLDDCILASLPSIRIIHGKGTGALRNGIHSFLKTHPHIKSFRLGTYGEGEMGVTVALLK